MQRAPVPHERRAAGLTQAEPGAVSVTVNDIFCWAVQGPSDAYLMDLARYRMKACGDFVVFSNFSYAKHNVVKIFEGDMYAGLTPGGWSNNTGLFLTAWKRISESPWPKQYKWFVKVDADTFFRPQMLPKFLSNFNPTDPVALIQGGRVRGALEVMSASSFLNKKSALLYTRSSPADLDPYLGGEDVWLSRAFKMAGFRLAETGRAQGCNSFLLSYYNLPSSFRNKSIRTPGHAKNLPPSLLAKACQFDVPSQRNCVSRDIVAMHPVKDRLVYLEFMEADRICSRAIHAPA